MRQVSIIGLLIVVASCVYAGSSVENTNDHGGDRPHGQDGAPAAVTAESGLTLVIDKIDTRDGDNVRARVVFENGTDQDTVLNLGEMLANGKRQLPSAVRLELTDESGATRELHFSDKRFPGVAGRLDDYVVPLRAGSTYSLALNLSDFWCPESKEFTIRLTPQAYKLRATYTGHPARYLNSGTEGLKHLPYFVGSLRSDVVSFRIEE